MTAQIVIANKHGIALASDSAVTVSTGANQQKIYSANKLFALTKWHPVGVMIYNSAHFMGVPFEIIIKCYRAKIGRTSFGTLREYADDFVKYLTESENYCSAEEQDRHARQLMIILFAKLQKLIRKKIDESTDRGQHLSNLDISMIITREIDSRYASSRKEQIRYDFTEQFFKELRVKYDALADQAMGRVFEKLLRTITKENREKLKYIAIRALVCSTLPIDNGTGVVIAGFGDQEIFPHVESYGIGGMVNNKLIHVKYNSAEINSGNNYATIMPFAQREMVDTFMRGIDPNYQSAQEGFFDEMAGEYAETALQELELAGYSVADREQLKSKISSIGEKALGILREKLNAYSMDNYISPILSAVSFLPKDELSVMAEALVNLTSLKRHVTMDTETVGGAIDVVDCQHLTGQNH